MHSLTSASHLVAPARSGQPRCQKGSLPTVQAMVCQSIDVELEQALEHRAHPRQRTLPRHACPQNQIFKWFSNAPALHPAPPPHPTTPVSNSLNCVPHADWPHPVARCRQHLIHERHNTGTLSHVSARVCH